jgi:uncharacterized membrane protein YdbT with pleckstrin-like domain
MKTKLKGNEKIIIELHPHSFTLAVPFLITLAGILVGAFLTSMVGFWGILSVLLFVGFFAYKTLVRKNCIWVVTNLRVIDEEGVFTNHSKESPLDKINNISYTQTFWGKIFGYGNIEIQTAAEIGSTTYTMVEKPGLLKDTITQMQEAYKNSQIEKQANEMAQAIVNQQKANSTVASELEKLFELKQKGILTEEEYQQQKARLLNA